MGKVIITGSSGFIGQHLQQELKRREMRFVTVPRNILYDKIDLMNFLSEEDPEYIFHLAAYGNMSHQKDIEQIMEANITALFNMLLITKFMRYKAFVFVSSSAVNLPHETFYSATKKAGEALCKAFVDEFGKPIITIRPYSLYGPGEADFRFIPTVFRSCLKGEPLKLDPDPVHDWVYIEDFIKSMINTAENADRFKGKVVSVGTGVGTHNAEVKWLIENITNTQTQGYVTPGMRSYDTKGSTWVMHNMPGEICDYARTPLKMGLQKCYAYEQKRNKK